MIDTSLPKKISLDEALALQGEHVDLYPLEIDLLKSRIKAGGHSGEFLKSAFISCYRPSQLFQHSLGEIMKLDLEAIRLFHQILHIRLIPNWNDAVLYGLEQEILNITGGKS